MKRWPGKWVLAGLAAAGLLLGGGCTVPMQGAPSLSLLSRQLPPTSPKIKILGPEVEESDTLHWFLLLFMVGPMVPSHEAAAQRLLEAHHADLLVDAEMESSTYGIPYLYMQINSTVRGRPAVFVK
ncbi:MAG: hypothetical protein WC789_11440 [Lentisphaeria bacterium]|jgi:hypothetical protein